MSESFTVQEFAEKQNIDYQMANQLMSFLVKQGRAKLVGKRPTATGKGKPSGLYQYEKSFTMELK